MKVLRGLKRWLLLTGLLALAVVWAAQGLSTTTVLFTPKDLPRDRLGCDGNGRWFLPCGRDPKKLEVRRLTVLPLKATVPLGEPVGLLLEAETAGTFDDRILVLQPVVAEVDFLVVDPSGQKRRLLPPPSVLDVPGPPVGSTARWMRWLQYDGVYGGDGPAPAFQTTGVYRITAVLSNPWAPETSPQYHLGIASNTVTIAVSALPTLGDAVRLRRLHHGYDLWRALNCGLEDHRPLSSALSDRRDRCYDELLQYALATRDIPRPSKKRASVAAECLARLRSDGPAWMQYELDTVWAMQGTPAPAAMEWYLKRYPTARETANLRFDTVPLAEWLGLPSMLDLLTPPLGPDTGRP